MALTNYKSMVLLDEYLSYLEVIKGRSHNTVIEYRTDILMFLNFIGSIIFFVGLPPRNVLICYATLDRMEKQCCSFITDGEELKNNLLFLRQAT